MKTLYISDLDGTLLTPEAQLSDYTIKSLRILIENQVPFTIATARTSATVMRMFDPIPLKFPLILMNGVAIYDPIGQQYLKTQTLDPRAARNLFSLLEAHQLTGFLFGLDENNHLTTYYENLDSPINAAFYKERAEQYGKVFAKVPRFGDCIDKKLIYFSICEQESLLRPFYEELKKDHRLHIEFYKDIYHLGHWYLEVCSFGSSKRTAAEYLKKHLGFDRIIGFGDNLNDIPLFEASDACYAVENAKEELKAIATGVIPSNTQDGVAKWLLENALSHSLTKEEIF